MFSELMEREGLLAEVLRDDQVYKTLTEIIRADFSFSDYGMGETFFNLSLHCLPYTADLQVSAQMVRDLALKPAFDLACKLPSEIHSLTSKQSKQNIVEL